jgi:hypothetical protein
MAFIRILIYLKNITLFTSKMTVVENFLIKNIIKNIKKNFFIKIIIFFLIKRIIF